MHRSIGFALLLGCGGSSPETSPEPEPVATELRWRDVTSDDALSKLAADARANGRGLMLDVRANWCMPCLDLESKTFSDPEVRAVLSRDFVVARLDVTDSSADTDALKVRVGGHTIPWVVFWTMTPEDAKAFAEGEVPPPAKTVSTFVSAQELLPLLGALSQP